MSTTDRADLPRLESVEAPGSMLTHTAARSLAVLRIATGFVFLWAFLDKTFGFGYATPSARAWINGGSPAKGFLGSLETGPFAGAFHSMAGNPLVDWLFMLGLLGIGAALMAGIGLRIGAVATALMMAFMWVAEWPLTAGSSNPLVDYHVVYALAASVVALTYAGHTWGLGRAWAGLPLIQKNRWLI